MPSSPSTPNVVALILRPFGYLLVALVWSALSVTMIALSGALLVGLWSSGWEPSRFFDDVDVVVVTLELIVIALIWVALLGWAQVVLPLASVPLAVLAWTYVVRSLRPSYRAERLSGTRQARGTIGPVTVTGTVAMSLLPVRPSPWTDVWARLSSAGWNPPGRIFVAGAPWGLATFLAPGWILWPVGPVPAVLWSLFSVAALAVTVVLVVRSLRAPTARRGVQRPSAGTPARSR
ncbi:hypothetical protein [Curtobacterium sp. ISL-83]|uniref:hypothetical protein n=1 Tax=Curtobacterium sp. ISL-83 TaxID=2819145 RepID=UPI001BE93DB0|nr:hypothetical protein [Curtobacterium sp. ISL-83]MBT2503363.1 hypothetical protein [Curtobacterium sp. ISL-83]